MAAAEALGRAVAVDEGATVRDERSGNGLAVRSLARRICTIAVPEPVRGVDFPPLSRAFTVTGTPTATTIAVQMMMA